MPKTGRNEPCPCGSGKKYKKCCLLSRGASTYYTKAERDTALMSVVAFLRAADELENDLLVEFYEDCPPPIEGSGLKDMSDISFEAWACFDVMISDGRTLSDIAINDHRLSAGERGYLEVMRRSAVRLYGVVEVVPGATLALRDVITDEVQVVQERRGSEQIPRWSLIATRVVPCGSAEPPLVCDGGILPFGGPQRDGLIEHVHTVLDAYRRDCPELPEAEVQLSVFKTLASTFHRLWITPMLPKALVNYDGDPLLFAESFFDLHDPDAATSSAARSWRRRVSSSVPSPTSHPNKPSANRSTDNHAVVQLDVPVDDTAVVESREPREELMHKSAGCGPGERAVKGERSQGRTLRAHRPGALDPVHGGRA